MCGHESPPGSSFCLNCGTALAALAPVKTPVAAAGLPVFCPSCRGENPPGMKFCRNCGTNLVGAGPAAQVAAQPGAFANMPPSGPLASLTPNPQPGMAPPPPTLPPGAASVPGIPIASAPGSPTIMPGAAVAGTPLAALAPVPLPYGQEPPPTLQPGPPPAIVAPGGPAARPGLPAGTIACPRCGAVTPIGFVYCQACGLHIQAVAPTDPGPRARPVSQPPLPYIPPTEPQIPPTLPGNQASPLVDPQGATLAAPARPPAPQAGVAWGTAVLVNRDGTDGERHPLDAEYTVIGRAGADIAFDEDRFLARLHARLERGGDGVVRVAPTDTLNGVFRKTDAPVELTDGLIILVGREVLRFERVELEERNVTPLIRHGVALFGSPPREPWGRLLQILPSGGYRDIRHLVGDEVVLGREEGDVVFRDDAFMSRRHAAITWDGKRAQLTDLGSSNGTFVRLTGATVIKHGDHLRLGDQLLRIELGR